MFFQKHLLAVVCLFFVQEIQDFVPKNVLSCAAGRAQRIPRQRRNQVSAPRLHASALFTLRLSAFVRSGTSLVPALTEPLAEGPRTAAFSQFAKTAGYESQALHPSCWGPRALLAAAGRRGRL